MGFAQRVKILAVSNFVVVVQGMTLDCVEMSLSRCFEAGQAYVALSRAKSLKSVRVVDFHPSCVRADPDALEFYRTLRRTRRNYIEYNSS